MKMKRKVQSTPAPTAGSEDGGLSFKVAKRSCSKTEEKSPCEGSVKTKRTKREVSSSHTIPSADVDEFVPDTDESDAGPPAKRARPKAKNKSAKKGPTKTEIKKERDKRWKAWCEDNEWKLEDHLGFKHEVRTFVVAGTNAKTYFCLKKLEIDTVPYIEFENTHEPSRPGRSYNVETLRKLVWRKFAIRNGVDIELDPQTQEDEFLKRGKILWDENLHTLEERAKQNGKTRAPLNIVQIRPIFKPRPAGSWETPVYENDKLIGWALNIHFDPDADEHTYAKYVLFRPVGANWEWGEGPDNPDGIADY